MTDTERVLSEIGLTDAETKVYLALLELGDSTRGAIVDKSQVSGSKVYEILEKLQLKGLVTQYVEQDVKHFKPTNPKQILTYIQERKDQISQVENKAQQILPQLLTLYQTSREDQEVALFSGLKGLEIIFREQVDLLRKGETCYVIGGTKGEEEQDVIAFFEKIHVLREAKGIKTKMLFNIHQKESMRENYSHQKFPNAWTRYIEHRQPVAINVYKDRTVIIIFGKKISAIQIVSIDVAKSFLEYFDILWSQGKK